MTEPYGVGTVTVANGGTLVTGVGTGWVGKVRKNDLFTDPAQGLFARVTADPTENDELTINAWPGAALSGDAYEIIPSADGIDISGRLRELLFGLSLVDPNFDAQVDTLPDRAAYDDRPGPTPTARGFAVLVSDDGAGAAIYSKLSNATADWSARAPYSGPTGAKGWSPEFAVVSDGARRVLQLVEWVGGEGTPPSGVGKYVGTPGLVDDIGDGIDIRGPAGDLTGVTPFWQGRITVDADDAAARAGLGAGDFSGPNAAVADRLVSFLDTSGKAGKDSGLSALVLASAITVVRTQTFTASGTYTPHAKMVFCRIRLQAAGGSGGSVASADPGTLNGASGGGAGEFSEGIFTAAEIGASKAVTLGAAGAVPSAGFVDGNVAGNSSVGTLITATGGKPGRGANPSSQGPSAAIAFGGTKSLVHGFGSERGAITTSTTSFATGSAGADSPWGQGGEATLNAAGNPGYGYGSGGSGASSFSGLGARSGGAGAPAKCIIEEFCSE